MKDSSVQPNLGRSFGALLGGFLVVLVLSVGTDMLLRAIGVFPSGGQVMSANLFLLAMAYRIVYAIISSYAVAWLAPNRPMQHALLSGLIGLVLSILGAIAAFKANPPLGPNWYPITLIITALPCAWLGGALYLSRSRKTHRRQS